MPYSHTAVAYLCTGSRTPHRRRTAWGRLLCDRAAGLPGGSYTTRPQPKGNLEKEKIWVRELCAANLDNNAPPTPVASAASASPLFALRLEDQALGGHHGDVVGPEGREKGTYLA